jgi:hypothetical protein
VSRIRRSRARLDAGAGGSAVNLRRRRREAQGAGRGGPVSSMAHRIALTIAACSASLRSIVGRTIFVCQFALDQCYAPSNLR